MNLLPKRTSRWPILIGLLAAVLLFVFAFQTTVAQEIETLGKDTAAKVFPKKPYSPLQAKLTRPTSILATRTYTRHSRSNAVMFSNPTNQMG